LASLGIWLSCLGNLDDTALGLLSSAAPECLWRPLKDAYLAYADLASGPTISDSEAAFNEGQTFPRATHHNIIFPPEYPAAGQ
jgi:hypothetical protein